MSRSNLKRMSNTSRSLRVVRRSRPSTLMRNLNRPRDPNLFPVVINPAMDIPVHIANPRVTRIIRFLTNFTNTVSSLIVTPNALALQDASDYGVATVRYPSLRIQSIRAWIESPSGLSVAVTPFSIRVTEVASGFVVNDRGLTGAQYSKAGFTFSFAVRTSIYATSALTSVATVATDQTIPASTIVPVVIDVTVEFI